MKTGLGTIAVGHGNWEPAGAVKAKAAMGCGAAMGCALTSGGGTRGAAHDPGLSQMRLTMAAMLTICQ